MPDFPFDLTRLIEICRSEGVASVGIFGSMARGDWTADSDIDMLVKFRNPVGLFELAHLKNSLTVALGRDVDLATESMLSPYLVESVQRDVVIIYDALD